MPDKDIIKAGIVTDDYRLSKFKKMLNERGFSDFSTSRFCEGVTTIQVKFAKEKLDDFKKLCQEVELWFQRGN